LREDTQLIRFGIGRFAGDAWQRPLRLLAIPFLAELPPGPPPGTRAAPTLCIDAQRLQACRDLDELMGLVRTIGRAQSVRA